jgi:hypothetical protein
MNQQSLTPTQKYRIVQWGAGNIGTRAMRAVIEHPNMTLVGLKEIGEKVGRDAGELCGLGPIGVKATDNIDDIIALKPDCVLYMQQGTDFDDVCKLLASGANIVTTRGDFHNPARLDPVVREHVEEACRRGGTSIHSTGSSPGFITEAVPLVLTSIQRRLDCLTIDEFADLSSRDSAFLLFQVMGFGKGSGKINPLILAHVRENFGPSLSLVADAISMPLDGYEASGEIATARQTTRIAAGVIEAGTMAAQRITISGMRGGQPLLRFRANWYCTTDVDPSWGLRESGWHVLVEGDTPLDIDIRYPVPLEKYAAFSPGLTAHRPVNAIPYVCVAAPGIRTILDLPQIIPMLG